MWWSIEIFLVCFVTYFHVLRADDLSTSSSSNINVWTGILFPNPQNEADFKRCYINRKSAVCDPDNILMENSRQNIIKHLEKLSKITSKNNGTNDECENQGIIGGVAIAKSFDGGNSQTLKHQAKNILRRWNLDPNCDKSFVIVLAHLDRSRYIAADLRIPLNELNEITDEEEETIITGGYEQAILNILDEIARKVLHQSKSNSRQVKIHTEEHTSHTTHGSEGPKNIFEYLIWFGVIGIFACALGLACMQQFRDWLGFICCCFQCCCKDRYGNSRACYHPGHIVNGNGYVGGDGCHTTNTFHSTDVTVIDTCGNEGGGGDCDGGGGGGGD